MGSYAAYKTQQADSLIGYVRQLESENRRLRSYLESIDRMAQYGEEQTQDSQFLVIRGAAQAALDSHKQE